MKRKLYLGFCALMVGAAINTEAAVGTSFMTEGQNLDGFYEIDEYQDLVDLSANSMYWSSNFIQTMDIDASASNDGMEGFSPIGNLEHKFRGNYNGNNKIISNLFISRPTQSYIGLFGYVRYGSIVNVVLENNTFVGDLYIGSIIGYNWNSKVTNCHLKDVSIIGNTFVGGVVGAFYGSEISICSTSGNVIATNGNVGGIIGYGSNLNASLLKSVCEISSVGFAGGLIGHGSGSLSNSYFIGEVTSEVNVGGLVGPFGGTILNSYNIGLVNSPYGGGLSGEDSDVSTIGTYWNTLTSNKDFSYCTSIGEETPFFILMQQNEGNWPWAADYASGSESNPWIPNPGGYPYLFFEEPQPTLYAVWTGAESIEWFNPNNWLNEIQPMATSDVLILPGTTHDAIISDDEKVTIKSLWIPEAARFQLSAPKFVQGGAEFNTETSPSLIVTESVVNNGYFAFTRSLDAGLGHYISSPVEIPEGVPFAEMMAITALNVGGNMYQLDYNGMMGLSSEQYNDDSWDLFFSMEDPLWIDLLHSEGDFEETNDMFSERRFEKGIGYYYNKSTLGPDNSPIYGAAIVFEGDPILDEVEIPARRDFGRHNDEYGIYDGTGYNMFGNPYTSSIAMNEAAQMGDNFITVNEECFAEDAKAVYIWNPRASEVDGEPVGNWQVINNDGYVEDPDGLFNGEAAASGFIMPAQGFIVKSKDKETPFKFTPAMRKHFDNDAKYYKTNAENIWAGVQVNLTRNDGFKTSTRIGVNNLTTSGLDAGYDVSSLYSTDLGFGENISQIYTRISGSDKAFATQSVPTSHKVVELGVNVSSNESGYYSFDISREGVSAVSIEDLETGNIYDMKESNFEVYLEGGKDYTNRFVLHLGKVDGLEDFKLASSIVCVENELIFDNVEGKYQIFDLAGKLVKSGNAQGKEVLNLQKGNYVVSANGVVEKISIK